MITRYSTRPLPASPYIPGQSRRDERPPAASPRGPVDIAALAADDDFRYGLDLFNHGFPWEAHEAWEPLWHAAPRPSPERALLQGLIHAAAAAVKARAGAVDPARNFVRSACEYLAQTDTNIIDAQAFARALFAWAHDPTQLPPTIALRA